MHACSRDLLGGYVVYVGSWLQMLLDQYEMSAIFNL